MFNGPMGVFEMTSFVMGTAMVAELTAEEPDQGVTTIVGGEDSVVAINQARLELRVSSNQHRGRGIVGAVGGEGAS